MAQSQPHRVPQEVAWGYAEKRTDGGSALVSKPWSMTVVRSGWYHAEVFATNKCAGKQSRQIQYIRRL